LADVSNGLGGWDAGTNGRRADAGALAAALRDDAPVFLLDEGIAIGGAAGAPEGPAIRAYSAPLAPERLGDPTFRSDHGLRYSYVAGAMANGIGSEGIVEAMAGAGMLGFFGAAGLAPARIEAALQRVTANAVGLPYGFNLINSPGDPVWQEAAADLYLRYGVRLIEASAYVALSLPLVKYRVTGLSRGADGRVIAPNRVIAKLSRVEVAERFFSPPPEKMLKKLVESGDITEEQAAMAAEIPLAQDVTVEADSGGHTDHRPALSVLPSMLALRDVMQARYPEHVRLRVGLGGGIGTPAAVAAAFGMGAAYVVTGSINQACRESGSSDLVRGMLAKASQTDVGQAPAADMFEMGVTVQVLSKGTRFVTRGGKLFQLYKAYDSIDAIPAAEREKIEKEIFRDSLDNIWSETRAFFEQRDPAQIEKAEANPRHKMSLVFRWYLGQSSRWANAGEADRQEDFQIWCGPSMGAFNEWTAGTPLEPPENRSVALVARELLAGACVSIRAAELRRQGAEVSPALLNPKPEVSA